MPIKVTCECGKVTNVPDAYAGRTGKCPGCMRPVKVPMLQPVAAVQPAAIQPAPVLSHAPAPESDSASEPTATLDPESPPSLDQEPRLQHETGDETAPTDVASSNGDESAVTAQEAADYDASESAAPADVHAPQDDASDEGGDDPIESPQSFELHIPTVVPQHLRRRNCPPLHLIISTNGADILAKFDVSPVFASFVETFAMNLKTRFDVHLDLPEHNATAPIVNVRVTRIGITSFEVAGDIQSAGKQPIPFTFKHKPWFNFFGGNSLSVLTGNANAVARKLAVQVKRAI